MAKKVTERKKRGLAMQQIIIAPTKHPHDENALYGLDVSGKVWRYVRLRKRAGWEACSTEIIEYRTRDDD